MADEENEKDTTKYVTSTAFRIGVEGKPKPVEVPEDTPFDKISQYFDEDEKLELIASGSLVPMNVASAETAEENESLREELEESEAEKKSLAEQVEELTKQLAAAQQANKQGQQNPPK